MERTKETLEARVRETPLAARLKECQKRIGKMCSEGRPPRMRIPVQHDDDDFFICTTLADAQAQIEALQRERDHAKKMEAVHKEVAENQTWHVRELRTAFDAEREKAKNDATAYRKLSEQWNATAL